MLTLQEQFGDLRGVHLAYVGDGNNVAHSLMLAAASLGASISVGTPTGYEPNADDHCSGTGAGGGVAARQVQVVNDAVEAVAGADAVYTDVWASMGQEDEAAERQQDLRALPGESEAVLAMPPSMPCSCTVCRRIAATKLRRRSSIRRVRLSSIRQRIACTFRNPFWFYCWKAVSHRFPPRSAHA